MGLVIDVAIAKTNKYAMRESGDTAEVVERPGGGLSVVVVDGQGSGPAAKTLSLSLTSKAVALLKEGVRDGAVARAVHDGLIAYRHGKVSASLDIVSIDLRTRTVVVTRNASTPLLIGKSGEFELRLPTSQPIGLYHFTRPMIEQFAAEPGFCLAVVTDGVTGSGERTGRGSFDMLSYVRASLSTPSSAADLADGLLLEAIRRDQQRPGDDMTVAALMLLAHDEEPMIRRLHIRMPVP
ncbi:MAG TPA: SpoIIE family protein phosphatase [Thermomicrobiales bacterium]